MIYYIIYLVENAEPITEQFDEDGEKDMIEMNLDETQQEDPISTVVKEPEQPRETP